MLLKNKNSGITDEIRIKRCYGCGTILQSKDPSLPGFIKESKLNEEENCLCERCYRLRHYNIQDVPHFSEDYEKILKRANSENALIVYVIDLFAFEASMIDGISEHLGKKVLVILNKRDILPKSLQDDKIIANAKRQLLIEHISPLDIVVTSSSKNYNLDELFMKMNKLREGKNVYFIGASQVGKSSIINAILKNYKNETDKCITTSMFPGTTLDIIDIPLDNLSSMYDTPGIFKVESIYNHVERTILRYIIPRDEIKPRVFQSGDKQSYILGALVRLDFVSGNKTNIIFNFSNDIAITRTKLDKGEKTFNSLAQTGQVKPTSMNIKIMSDLEKHSFTLPSSGLINIKIFGMGYITLEANCQVFDLYTPKNVGIKVVATDIK